MPKKIAIITPVFPPYRGGIGRVAETDATHLAELGYQVHVYAPGAKPVKKTVGGFTLHHLGAWFRFGHAAFTPNISRLLNSHDAVIMHFPFFGTAEPMAIARELDRKLNKKRRGKLIFSYHMDVSGRGFVVPLFSAPTRAYISEIMHTADRVLLTTFDYARTSSLGKALAQSPDLFRELLPCVNTEHFSPGVKNTALLEHWGIPAGAPLITFVGGLDSAHYFKGVPVLLHALASQELSDARLIAVGNGNLKKIYQDLAEKLGIADRVVFAGGVTDAALVEILRLADVFAFPSLDRSEAFGLAALEAMSCGVPVVASDLPGVRTIVRRGETGSLVPAGSSSALALALAKICNDHQMRDSMGKMARKMAVEEYGHARHKERLAEIMRELGL